MKIKIEIHAGTHYITIEDSDLVGMDENQKLNYIEEVVDEEVLGRCAYSWKEVK